MVFLCNKPSCDFSSDTLSELKKHELNGHHNVVQEIPSSPLPSAETRVETKEPIITAPKPPPAIKRRIIALEYKFTGQCDFCGKNVKTITIEFENSHVVCAYCSECDKKLQQRKVIPLDKQEEMMKPKWIIDKSEPIGEVKSKRGRKPKVI